MPSCDHLQHVLGAVSHPVQLSHAQLQVTPMSYLAVDMQDDPLLKVPDFLKAHPELRTRGINLTEPLKPVSA